MDQRRGVIGGVIELAFTRQPQSRPSPHLDDSIRGELQRNRHCVGRRQ